MPRAWTSRVEPRRKYDSEFIVEREEPAIESAVAEGVERDPIAGIGTPFDTDAPWDDVAGVNEFGQLQAS